MKLSRLAILALIASSLAVAQEPCVPQRVISPPEISTPDFGFQVATDGAQWFVSSTDANTLCPGPTLSCSTGAVFVYDNVDGELVLAQTIVPPDVALYDNFGQSMDMDGGRLAVGALFSRNPDTGDRTGAVFIYEFDGVEWVEVDRIWAPPSVASEFGRALSLRGDTLIVTTQQAKSAEVYKWEDSTGWRHVQTVTQPDPTGASIGFGVQWSSRDDWLITGGYLDRRVVANGGAVFVYRADSNGSLELVQEIPADGEAMYLGISLAFAGDTLVVGAPLASRDHLFQGVVRFYEFDGERWVFDRELTQAESRQNRRFGNRVLYEHGRLYVTADIEYTPVSRGMAYAYERDASGAWVQVDRFVPNPVRYADHYGWALASDGKHLLAAAREDQTATGGVVGAAYLFDLECGDCRVDLDADGALTIFDFLTFFNMFDDGDAQADFDGDGELTIFDFLAFQTAFDAGCP